ncbi:hypothetical protein [Paraburkholderia sp.]|uniref:hypothetical protein n=1 Tax=Paraburkholderia sp. TaxID=1926495 RepID=UPI003D70108F
MKKPRPVMGGASGSCVTRYCIYLDTRPPVDPPVAVVVVVAVVTSRAFMQQM